MKTLYLIRHSGPYIEIDNYFDYENVLWSDYNRNMMLSVDGEKRAENISLINELKDIDKIYSSDSARAIATAKYIAEKNNLKIKLDKRIDEREFGIEKLSDLPSDFTKHSFDDKNYKVGYGESLNDVDNRMSDFINTIIKEQSEKTVVVLHGIILMSYLGTLCNFQFDGKQFNIRYKNKIVLEGVPKNPDIYKLTFDDMNNLTDIENVR